MARNRLMLDLAQCEVFNHLPPMKAGILIKAITDYWMTGEVSPWGVDVDLKPIFMTFRATLEEDIEEEEEKQRKEKRRKHAEYLRRKGNSPNSPGENGEKESESERDGDEEKRTKREEEEEKAKGKEPEKETLKRNEAEEKNKQTELFEPEEAHKKAKEPQFRKPSLADVADYIKEKGYEQWVDAEEFWHFYESKDWMVGKTKMKKWQSAVITWVKAHKNRQQQRSAHGTSVGERAYNMLHFEYEGHPEMWKEEEKKIAELQKYF